MKKILFLLFMSLSVYAVQAQTCTPNLVVDDIDMTISGNQLIFEWDVPSSGGTGGPPPPPPGFVSYNIEIQYGTATFGGISWGSTKGRYGVTYLSSEPQTITAYKASNPTYQYIRMRIQLIKDDGTCEHSWSSWYEFPI